MTITNKVSLKSVNGGNTPIADVPDAPTIGAATNVGTSRAYNNGSATVAYTAAATGGAVTTFTATSTPGGFTGTGASPITVTGLQSATSYTFTVSAANSSGTLTSSSSSSITATTVPQAPTIGTATLSGTSASVTFTAGATGGSAITGYTVTSSPGGFTGTGASSPITVSGLSYNTAYTFTVTATNANGTSAASSASSAVTPTIVVGGPGPGGGTVFYDAGSTLSWGRYMEAAPNTWYDGSADPQLVWSGNTNTSVSTSTAIGTAFTNTSAAIAQSNTPNRAVTASRAYAGGSQSNWSLPSYDDLRALYDQRALVGGFSEVGQGWYLSSSTEGGDFVWSQNFLYGNRGADIQRTRATGVRPIRYFSS